MRVIATAGHVDHGKSTLVRTLTGTDPDRLIEEKQRGLTIALGFAGLDLPSGTRVGFVDVPGHRRFIGTMLAGLGPSPAVMFVVAADQGWQAQSAEHLAAVDALGIRNGLLVLTRTGLADTATIAATRERALAEVAPTSLGAVEVVETDALHGVGLQALVGALDRLVGRMPPVDADGPVRLWVDRSFTVRGTGTVVTGTLAAGTLRVGDRLVTASGPATIRGLQVFGEAVESVGPVARVAVALRGVSTADVPPGSALLTPDAFLDVEVIDVRADTGLPWSEAAPTITVHAGTAAVKARVRPLDEHIARLTLDEALPLRIVDRVIVRDPSASRIHCGATVLDLDPAPLSRRGDGRRRAELLASWRDGDADQLVADRGFESVSWLTAAGAGPLTGELTVRGWAVSPDTMREWADALRTMVARDAGDRLSTGLPVSVAADRLGAPEDVLQRVAEYADAQILEGRIVGATHQPQPETEGPDSVDQLRDALRDKPFQAPEAQDLEALGLGPRQLATAARQGRLLRLPTDVVLLPDAPARAMRLLAALPQPFTASEARACLGTTRRVLIPLLEHLDERGWTRRVDANRREVVR